MSEAKSFGSPMIIAQDFSRSPVSRLFHSSQRSAAVRIGEPSAAVKCHGCFPLGVAAKTKAKRRDITPPDIALQALREQRKRLLETRMKLGLGKLGGDDLLFANLEGKALRPSAVSSGWGELAESIGMPEVTFHALRHTHASQLIAQGVDIVTIWKRLGHAKPSVTLAIYAHMITSDDRKAAAAINAALNP